MPQPWQLVADVLRRAIAEQKYQPGDQLPSEHQLAELHGVSRPTVRLALRELRLRGLIETQQGRGAFVRRRPSVTIVLTARNYQRHQRAGKPGFDAQVREQGHVPGQELIEVALVPAPPEIAQRLALPESADVIVRRLRFTVDGQPVQLVRVYYDANLAVGTRLDRSVLIPQGAHSELRLLGVEISRLVEEFREARLPDSDEQQSLRLPSGVPIVQSTRTAYAGDRPVEVLDAISHGEMVSFRFELDL